MKNLFVVSLSLICLFCSNIAIATLSKTIVFASEASYPPFESVNPNGELQGFDIDLAKAICQQVNLKCVFIHQPWESLIPGLKLGKFDALISAMAITESRKKQIAFSDPYFTPTGSFAAAKNGHLSLTPEGLKNKSIGVQKATTFELYLKEKYKHTITIKTYPNFQSLMLDLKANRIDAALGDTPIVENWLNTDDNHINYTLVGTHIYNPKYFGTGYGIAVKSNNMELLQAINKGLKEIKENGTYQKIYHTYFK